MRQFLPPPRDAEHSSPERVLVVGADPGLSVVSCAWPELPVDLNVADYELVILNLAPARIEETQQRELLGRVLTPDRIRRLLQGPGSELVLIGHVERQPDYLVASHFPGAFVVQAESGSHITNVDAEFSAYFEQVKRYRWIVREVADAPNVPAETRPLALASGRDIVAIAVRWLFPDQPTSRVVWLPAATECSPDEAIRGLLVRNYGLGWEGGEPPAWLAEVHLPAVERMASDVAVVDEQLTKLGEQRLQLQEALNREQRFLEVLYETGGRLEVVVRDLLRELGLQVRDPEGPGGDDGTAETPAGRRVVLEIKGRAGQLRLGDVRQLDQWVTDRQFPEGSPEPEQWEGLLVVNAWCETPLEERDDPYGPLARQLAQGKGLTLITTAQLIEALRAKQEDEFDPSNWWDRVLDTRGPFEP